MRYVKTIWNHELDDEPVHYFSELDEDGYEVRKVQLFRDGRSEWADTDHETASVGLSEIPFPSVAEISESEECAAEEISAENFEEIWNSARDVRRGASGLRPFVV